MADGWRGISAAFYCLTSKIGSVISLVMSKKGRENASQAFFFFHLHVGTRLSLRIFIPLVAVFFSLYYVLGYEFFLSLMATVLDGGFPLSGIFTSLILMITAKFAARRICLGLCGWIRHLPAEGSIRRRMAGIAVFIAQIPILVILAILALLAAKLYSIPALPYLVGLPFAGLSCSFCVMPIKSKLISRPLASFASICLASNEWVILAGGTILLIAADWMSGPLVVKKKHSRFRTHLKGSFFIGTINWRALKLRLLFPYLLSLPFIGATRLFLANNDVSSLLAERVIRFGGALSLIIFCSIFSTLLATRRPPWPWIRSLPWSATSRLIWDSAFISLHLLPLLLIIGLLNLQALLPLILALPLFAVHSSYSIRQAPGSRMGASGKVLFFGVFSVLLLCLIPLSSVIFLVLAPLFIKEAVNSEKRQKVSLWLEIHHLAAGDSLSWSGL